ncbi:hypothetical protein CPLU01_01504 [Colletotrichum plurivorum]|uniref:mRNA splicing factor RNA helicase n=1 Tax=Colletotrichum plurivorum TaxID=2175906 RepID=A0A8H6NP12_9PEZI|nr:hypothetical protein CPLU01_01504 [Colletotrichum plurivorum]
MDHPAETAPVAEPPIVFRAYKKRKAGLRQRAASPDEAAADAPTSINTIPDPSSRAADPLEPEFNPNARDADGQDETDAGRSAVRHRARKRFNGVGFSASRATPGSDSQSTTDPSSSRALALFEQAPDDDPLIAKRFAPQTGTATTIVNKHMMEYIESHLSNRKSPAAEPTNATPQAAGSSSSAPPSGEPTAGAASSSAAVAAPENGPKNHPILQGKLMEVDLGDEARARNQALTERAARRMLGEPVPEEENEGGRRAKKPRLGRDGKPWRPRNRRGSDDIKRDQLVEEFLRENRLDVYDVPATQQPQYEGDGDADDRIAEEFRREFMDAMVQRQQKKKTAAPPARAGARKADDDVLKGPKLGGSRNSRAAMRDLLLKKEKESKK